MQATLTTATPAILNEVMSDVTVYTTDPCSFCARVKGLLKARGVEFAEINLSKDPDGRVELARKTGMMTFPQVLVDGQRLDELLVGQQPAA
jgi:glutaredoxin 3